MNWLHKKEEDLDNEPSKASIHEGLQYGDRYYERHWYQDFPWKRFRRFCESGIGRSIDDIISDITHASWLLPKHRNMDSVNREIELNTFKDGGVIFYYCKYSLEPKPVEGNHRPILYVDPDTRQLRQSKPVNKISYTKKLKKELADKVKILGDYHQLVKIKGIWYEVKAAPVSVNSLVAIWMHRYRQCGPKDILLGDAQRYHRNKENHPFVEITLKRQLNSSELKKHNLNNDLIAAIL